QTVEADTWLIGKMMKHQRPAAQAIGANLERGSVSRKRVGSAIPGRAGLLGDRSLDIVFAVVEHELETPIARLARQRNRLLGRQIREIRRAVTVKYTLEVEVSGAGPVALVSLGEIDIVRVFP